MHFRTMPHPLDDAHMRDWKELQLEFDVPDLERYYGVGDSLRLRFYRALERYYEWQMWERFPDEGGLYDQSYEWKVGVECVKVAQIHHENEERLRQHWASAPTDDVEE